MDIYPRGSGAAQPGGAGLRVRNDGVPHIPCSCCVLKSQPGAQTGTATIRHDMYMRTGSGRSHESEHSMSSVVLISDEDVRNSRIVGIAHLVQ
jgi:hypothetical protein